MSKSCPPLCDRCVELQSPLPNRATRFYRLSFHQFVAPKVVRWVEHTQRCGAHIFTPDVGQNLASFTELSSEVEYLIESVLHS